MLPARTAGSFRDPESYVARVDGRFMRIATGTTADVLRDRRTRAALDRLAALGRVIGFTDAPTDDSAAVAFWVETLPFVSYPYEWSFEMLRDAAIAHLDIQIELLAAGLVLKDAAPSNVQFQRTRPMFIDLGSLARYEAERPWAAYSQFCALFLNPLLLSAYCAVPFQPWLRASPAGIAPATLARLLPLHRRLLPPALTHVTLQALVSREAQDLGPAVARGASVAPAAMRGQLERLRHQIHDLRSPGGASAWSGYTDPGVHAAEYRDAKTAFVRSVLAQATPRRVYDLGSNTGQYADIALEAGADVVAVDADAACIDAMYVRHRASDRDILPLVVDVLDPSPAQGWAGTERAAFVGRGERDFFLALALTHHVCVTGNVPLAEWIHFLATIGRRGIVEFIPTDDPMFQRIVAWRPKEGIHPYDRETFESALATHFRVVASATMPGARRTLYFVESN